MAPFDYYSDGEDYNPLAGYEPPQFSFATDYGVDSRSPGALVDQFDIFGAYDDIARKLESQRDVANQEYADNLKAAMQPRRTGIGETLATALLSFGAPLLGKAIGGNQLGGQGGQMGQVAVQELDKRLDADWELQQKQRAALAAAAREDVKVLDRAILDLPEKKLGLQGQMALNKQNNDAAFEKQKEIDRLRHGYNLREIEAQKRPVIVPPPSGLPSSDSLGDVGPNLGVPNLRDYELQRYRENLAAGMSSSQAAISARADVEDRRKRTKDLFGDKLAKEAETIGQMEDLINKGREGIAKAGMTGSGVASTYEQVLATFPGLFPEAAVQSAGDKLLTLTQNIGAMANRIVGSGAMSDFETKALFATAMSPDSPRPQNEAVLRSYENGLAIMKEHQNFINHFMERTGGNPDRAQMLWDIYRKQNPILVQNARGEVVVNPNRSPWQTFDFDSAYRQYMTGGGMETATGSAGGKPDALSDPEGYKAWYKANRGGSPRG